MLVPLPVLFLASYWLIYSLSQALIFTLPICKICTTTPEVQVSGRMLALAVGELTLLGNLSAYISYYVDLVINGTWQRVSVFKNEEEITSLPPLTV